MAKGKINNNILAFALIAIIFLSHMTRPTVSKYMLTQSGRAVSSLISGNVITDAFVLTNDSFIETGSDGSTTSLNEKTSPSLHGTGVTEVDGVLTVPKDADTGTFDLDSTSAMSFVVQNNSDYDLVACFDIMLCMGAIADGVLTCTITAPSTAAAGNNTELVVTASTNQNNQNSDITIKHHIEPDGGGGTDQPPVDVQIEGLFGSYVDYSAYSMQLDPTEFLTDQNGDGDVLDANELTQEEFDSFILVRSGETKTFEFSVEGDQNIIGQWFSVNCYASITMTVKKYPTPAS